MSAAASVAARTVNLVLAGVGGQGSVLATEIVGRAAVLAGHQVVTSEVHGMSQRGGTVVTAVRFGAAPGAPTVPLGEADFLVAFERLEALRFLHWLRPGGTVVLNDQDIHPTVESLKAAAYPEDVLEHIRARAGVILVTPALALARAIGNPKLASTALLGALSVVLDLPGEAWEKAVAGAVPAHTVEANLEAFAEGARAASRESGRPEDVRP